MQKLILKKSLFVAIILVISSIFSPLLTADDLFEEDVLVSFTVYIKSDIINCEAMLSYDEAIFINDLFKKLQYDLKYYPYSDVTESLKTSFIELLDNKGLLPEDVSNNDIVELLNPPYIHQLIQNMFLPCFLPSPKFSSSKGTAFFCSVASGGSGKTTPIVIGPRPRAIIFWNGGKEEEISVTTVGGIRTGKGFIAYGNQEGMLVGFEGVGITYGTPFGTIYGLTGYAIYASVTAELIEFYPPNSKPEISNPNPSNNQKNIPTTLSELSFQIHDDDNERMDYSVNTDPFIGSGSRNNVVNGIYKISVEGLQHSTTYSWTVSVTDGKDTTTNMLSFTTVQESPIITNPIPIDGSSTSIDLTDLSFTLTDAQGDKMDYTIETSPDIGSDSATDVGNGIYTMTISMLEENNWYYWYVNVTDGEHWTKEKYSFYTGGLGLVGYWNFDEGNGTIVHDNSGNGYDGKNVGCNWVTGKTGYGLEITDKTDRVESISSLYDDLISTAFTISAWIKWSGIIENNGIIFDGRSSYNHGGFVFYISSDEQLCFHLNQGSTDNVTVIRSKSNIPSGKWTLVTAVFNDNSDSWRLYINGLEDVSQSITYHYIKSSHNPFIGNNHWAPGDGKWRPFYGIIDELCIYNNSLSDSQIINIYNQRLSYVPNIFIYKNFDNFAK